LSLSILNADDACQYQVRDPNFSSPQSCPPKGPGVNFTNILHPAFTSADPKSVKIQLSCQYLFSLLGSVRIKAARKMLFKLTPGGFGGSAGSAGSGGATTTTISSVVTSTTTIAGVVTTTTIISGMTATYSESKSLISLTAMN